MSVSAAVAFSPPCGLSNGFAREAESAKIVDLLRGVKSVSSIAKSDFGRMVESLSINLHAENTEIRIMLHRAIEVTGKIEGYQLDRLDRMGGLVSRNFLGRLKFILFGE